MAEPGSLRISAVYATAQREKPGRSLAQGRGSPVAAGNQGSSVEDSSAPGFESHTYALPLTPAGRGQFHGSQEGYKRFQQTLWEQRQRGGPLHSITRKNGTTGAVMSADQIEDQLRKADAQMLLHAPIWMAWHSPYRLEVVLQDRGLVSVDLIPPTSELAKVHSRGTVESSSDPIGKMRNLGGAISAAFGATVGLIVLENEQVAVVQPSSELPDGYDATVPLRLQQHDVVLHRTDVRALQALISHDLELCLLVRGGHDRTK